jgi:hypothetical protein
MATSGYMTGRKRYQRPQAVLWSDNAGTLSNGLYVPTGYEVGAVVPDGTASNLIDQFIVLSDHNRSEISFNTERIEKRQRTINGRMRSYHIADKLNISFSWNNLPSRSHALVPDFNSSGVSPLKNSTSEYTADGGAGGVQLLDWYENHKGPFWMYLAYDKYTNFGNNDAAYSHLGQYNQIMQVYFSDFNYTVTKRGGSNFDLWNVSVTLEEA